MYTYTFNYYSILNTSNQFNFDVSLKVVLKKTYSNFHIKKLDNITNANFNLSEIYRLI